ncbi:D-lactate dehydrogenase [Lachnospiraceae bacterium TWA4]|nr:D-lactate dehydrogenase [Lachnospiraceae bacterium TWA4]
MKIAFYGAKPYDRVWFEPLSKEYGHELLFIDSLLTTDTIPLANSCQAVCVFVNDRVNKELIDILAKMNVKGILLRCAGFNNVDIQAANGKIKVLRVPSYSPEAIAEFAVALLLTINRKTHRAYSRTRDFNMTIQGLMGMDLHGKTAGVIGTGKIGRSMIKILQGFGMKILAYDLYPDYSLDIEYTNLDTLFSSSDVISLHCPLTEETHHLINKETISKMKQGVYLVNTSRGALIDSADLLDSLRTTKIFGGVALDVYEEEEGLFYEDNSDKVIHDDILARLTTFPHVLITSHQAFFTNEALEAIARVTLENATALENNKTLTNEVISQQ